MMVLIRGKKEHFSSFPVKHSRRRQGRWRPRAEEKSGSICQSLIQAAMGPGWRWRGFRSLEPELWHLRARHWARG